MKRFIHITALTALALLVLAACGGSSSPLGNLPDIIADACQQQEEFNEEAKNTTDKSAKSFEKMMTKAMKIMTRTAEKVEKEGHRLQGRSIPCVGGDEAYDFIKINQAVIDTVTFDMQRLKATVHVRFIPNEENGDIPYGSRIYYVFLDKEGKKILKGDARTSSLFATIKLGNLGGVPPERWKDLKEIRFLTPDGAQHF